MPEQTENLNSKCSCVKNYAHVVAFGIAVVLIGGLAGFGVWKFLSRQALNTITVSGSATSTLQNQIATFTATITVRNADKTAASKDAGDKTTALVDAVKKFGVAENDIKTSSLNVYQDQQVYYDNGLQKYKPGDWVVSSSIDIKLRDVSKASGLSTLLLGFDSASVYGPNLTVDNQTVDEASILANALANAKTKASALALKSGRHLGSVQSIVEGSTSGGIVPMYDKASLGVGGGGMTVETGTSDVTKVVTVTYYLN